MKYLLLLLVLFSASCWAERFREGEDYLRLEQRIDTGLEQGEVQVLEFFWYGCVHCYYLDRRLNQWLPEQSERVQFRRIPAVMQQKWLPHAKLFYASQRMGIQDKVHTPLFEALHDKQLPLHATGSLADFVAVKADVDPVVVESEMENMQTRAAILESMQLQKHYELSGVPTIVVNGRYMLNGRMAKGFSRMVNIMDFLVQRELQRTR